MSALLPLSSLIPSSLNQRKRWDRKGLEELAASIKAQGVLQPLLARPVKEGGDRFEVIAGMRRFLAAKQAGLEVVPVIVKSMTDEEAIEVSTVENLQREDQHPLDEAEGYRRLMIECGLKVEQIAAKVGKDVSYIYRRMKLRDLIGPATDAFLEGKITGDHALRIARLLPAAQKEALAACFEKDWRARGKDGKFLVPVRKLDEWIEENIHLSLETAPWKMHDADLVPKAGPCTTCPKRTGANPTLFGDIGKKDTCTDRACFGEKMGAHLRLVALALAEKGTKWVEVSDEYEGDREPKEGDPIPRPLWFQVTAKSCAHVQAGLIVKGEGRGTIVPVCVEKTCKTHRADRGIPGISPKEKAARRAAEKKRKDGRDLRGQLLNAVLVKVEGIGELGKADLALIASRAYGRLWHEHQRRIAKRRGWTPRKSKYGGTQYGATADQYLKSAGEDQIGAFLLEVALIGALDSQKNQDAEAALEATARRYHVKVAAVRKEKRAAKGKKA